ncbi:UNVERIFIED_CONTAM: hypothetical protein RMT77_001883 [Armadillidium vulgare]
MNLKFHRSLEFQSGITSLEIANKFPFRNFSDKKLDLCKLMMQQKSGREDRRKYCQQNARKTRKKSSKRNFIIDRKLSLIYCPIYKAGSSTWLTNLLKLRGRYNESEYLQKNINKVYRRVSAVVATRESNKFTTFLVVRHPFNRLVSCYRDKYENASKLYYYEAYGERMIRSERPRPKGVDYKAIEHLLEEVKIYLQSDRRTSFPNNSYTNPVGPTFREFLQYITSRIIPDDEHWIPYYIHCSLCRVKYDFVLRIENIEEDTNLLVKYQNLNISNIGWRNPTSGGVSTDEVVCKYFHEIDSNLYKNLVKKYEPDFKLFNYSSEKFYHCVQ